MEKGVRNKHDIEEMKVEDKLCTIASKINVIAKGVFHFEATLQFSLSEFTCP